MSCRLFVFLPRANTVRVQLQRKEGHPHYENQLHSKLLMGHLSTKKKKSIYIFRLHDTEMQLSVGSQHLI